MPRSSSYGRRAGHDGFGGDTVAVDMDPLSLVARLAACAPPPRFHTVKYASPALRGLLKDSYVERRAPRGEQRVVAVQAQAALDAVAQRAAREEP